MARLDNMLRNFLSTIRMDIAAFVISIVSLLVALFMLPTMFFLRWAKPNIVVEHHSSEAEEESGSRLFLVLRNLPVENKFQKWWGVTRGKATIRGRYIIKDTTGAYLETGVQFIRLKHKDPEVVIGLDEHEWATLPCVHHLLDQNFFCAGHDEHHESRCFQPGRYVYHVELDATGGNKQFAREFIYTIENGLEWGAFVKTGRGRV